MDYEKKYNEALERARADYNNHLEEGYKNYREHLETIFPELAESEDERIRKDMIEYFTEIIDDICSEEDIKLEEKVFVGRLRKFLAYLEKQKESLHIPETCKENAEYFTSQCGDNRFELIDKAKRDIIAKTNIESRPEEMAVLDNILYRCWQMGWLGKYDVIVPEQKPAEWSEEDKKIITRLIDYFESFRIVGVTTKWEGLDIQEVITLLKSLRPQYYGDVTMTEAYKMGLEAGKASSWKPSKEQMEALQSAINACESEWVYQDDELRSLLTDLEKLCNQ